MDSKLWVLAEHVSRFEAWLAKEGFEATSKTTMKHCTCFSFRDVDTTTRVYEACREVFGAGE